MNAEQLVNNTLSPNENQSVYIMSKDPLNVGIKKCTCKRRIINLSTKNNVLLTEDKDIVNQKSQNLKTETVSNLIKSDNIQDNMISIDPLTQTNNRNQMYKFLVKKMRNEESGMSLFLLIVDVDKLRAINDAFGHTEGDRALIRVASAIKDACQGPRGRMFVSRYGGDEFVIVAEMAYRAEATYLAEQIKNNLRRLSDIDGAAYDVTVSIGIAQYDYKVPVSLQAFIARADSDLYQNKKMNYA